MTKQQTEARPCGGCGATDSRKRCIGCMHDFGTPDSAWVHEYRATPSPAPSDTLERREAIAQIERECADLIARYYRREIGELMHQAEHWAENGKPLATHHRLHKADSYFQIVSLMERDPAKGWKLPFDEIRHQLARQPLNPPGTYPPTAELHRFRDASFAATLAKLDRSAEVG